MSVATPIMVTKGMVITAMAIQPIPPSAGTMAIGTNMGTTTIAHRP